ncbi:hypothetical protein [Bifidobacterium adolescentis]|uniref:hypothetical protein n=1 Tax=Bifidobacterium adolescentis TaxID=1680 RepID=UPI0022E366E4|nr:hypothetical protein [Bifidobacterium adolescentis]
MSGSVVSVSGGKVSYSAPSFDESPMTVWYKPDSSWKTAKVNYQANGKWSGGAQQMEASCGGWYRYTIPDTAGGQVLRRGRRSDDHRRHTKLHYSAVGKNEL